MKIQFAAWEPTDEPRPIMVGIADIPAGSAPEFARRLSIAVAEISESLATEKRYNLGKLVRCAKGEN